MPTINTVINNHIVPELLISKYRSSKNTTVAAHPRLEFKEVASWNSFQEEMGRSSQFYNKFLEIDPIYSGPPVKVASEAEVVAQAEYHVVIPFLSIIKALGFDFECRSHHNLPCIRFDPDKVLIDGGYKTPYWLMEYKTPWAFPIAENLDIATELKNEEGESVWNQKITRAVTQLYGYMSYNHMRFGILCNYDFYVFFSRSPSSESTLYYSQPIPKSQALETLLNFFFHIKEENSFYTSPDATPVEGLVKFNVPQNVTEKPRKIGPEHFRFMESKGSTEFGGIVKGNLGGILENVIFKVKNICRDNGIFEKLKGEAGIYRALKSLQGIAIPMCYGFVDFNGVFHALILEDCGVTIPDAYDEDIDDDSAKLLNDEEIRENALLALKMIHDKHILHGDIAARNICVNQETNQVRIVDFEKASKCRDPSKFEDEMNELKGLFPFLSKKRRRI